MARVGDVLREAQVAAVYLAHGTFVGTDALGILTELARVYPAAGRAVRRVSKQVVDSVVRDAGNYTPRYARTFEKGINRRGARHIPVRLFHWSSQNNHIGRADGAVRLAAELISQGFSPTERVLLWGHSHAGNVFALLSNLLAADAPLRDQFFRAARVYYRWPLFGCVDIPIWRKVRMQLDRTPGPLAQTPLDVVTFGTPIRYGWDSAGYSRLLHFVNHRPAEGLPEYQAPFPPTVEAVMSAADGDYVQQLGIAGTNIMPSLFAWRSWLADHRLNDMLQANLARRELIDRLKLGVRVPDEGTTLLVNYGPVEGNVAHHIAGHAVYTRSEWLLFHAEEVARRFYQAA